MKDMLSKLVKIESMVRALREEILESERQVENHSPLREISNLKELTPATWASSFTELRFHEPILIRPYEKLVDDFMIGFENTDVDAVRFCQEPLIKGEADRVALALQVWITRTVKWLTFEFPIPPALTSKYGTFYLYFHLSVKEAQRIRVFCYRRNASGETFYDECDPVFAFSDMPPDLKTIHVGRREDIVDCKICFQFDVERTLSMTLNEARLFGPLFED